MPGRIPESATKRRPKWGNTKTISASGLVFDSAWESRHYFELTIREKIGEIRNLQRQVRFEIEINGQLVCAYVADFVYEECRDGVWSRVVADCKSVATRTEPAYRLKNKLMRAVLGIEIREELSQKAQSWKRR